MHRSNPLLPTDVILSMSQRLTQYMFDHVPPVGNWTSGSWCTWRWLEMVAKRIPAGRAALVHH